MARKQVVTIRGLATLTKKLDQLPGEIRDGLKRAVKIEVEMIADDMRRGAPRDTGELVESIQEEVNPDGLGGAAVATARHATFVEHGTEDTPEQPFVMPAAVRSRRRFRKRLQREMGAQIKDLTA